jgi:erythrocyte band 7 integral membrane protein
MERKSKFQDNIFRTHNFSKDVRLPVQLQRAMAAEAEATREARAKVIAAEGEQKASRALREASEVIGDSPAALQLRYLQVNQKSV